MDRTGWFLFFSYHIWFCGFASVNTKRREYTRVNFEAGRLSYETSVYHAGVQLTAITSRVLNETGNQHIPPLQSVNTSQAQ
ncbi:hypothetical protein QR685DRAFT_234341 [Neurospora intermedia]|uniref:Secreted protein n=1 Tax=Neurospora intermedia TaxID=5142 RepID=A0ABR3DKS2_NEUIN